MKGIEISRAYFEEYGLPMLRTQFPDLLPLIAAGLAGSGSECFGFDDDVSRDHDFDPGFCLFLPGEDVVDRRTAFLLERACALLPREYMGIRRELMSPAGGPRRGVMRTADFFLKRVGSADGVLTLGQWLSLPPHALAEAVNGAVFLDNYGEFSRVRASLAHYPPDIRKKKLAACLWMMAQSGNYNYSRCVRHGETGAAQLAAVEFTQHAMAAIFLLNDAYMPFYKWRFRALRKLPRLSLLAELLEYLISTGNDDSLCAEKQDVISGIVSDVIREARSQGLSRASGDDPEKHAASINDAIADAQLRNMNPLEAL